MGILRLMQLLEEKAPNSIRQRDLSDYKGKTIACDASIIIYQFLVTSQYISNNQKVKSLTDKDLNLTGHLLGIYNRSIQYKELGINILWVFDGKPPEAKYRELYKRFKKKDKAKKTMKVSTESGDSETALKYASQNVSLSNQVITDAMKLVELLGLPYLQVT